MSESKQNNYMDVGEALSIVYELADQNTIDEQFPLDEHEDAIQEEAARQRLALDTVHEYIVNNFGEH